MINGNCFIKRILEKFKYIPSLLRRGLFVLWRGFCVVRRLGRKKKDPHQNINNRKNRKRAGHDGKGEVPIVPRALSIFSIIDILVGIPSGSLCGGERYIPEIRLSFVSICALWISSVDTCNANCLQCTPTFWHSQKGFKRFWNFLKAGIAVCWSFPRFFQSPFPVSTG